MSKSITKATRNEGFVINEGVSGRKLTQILDTKEELNKFRQTLAKNEFTEINLIYRAGKYVITYLENLVSNDNHKRELLLADSGLIRGSKAIRKELKELNSTYSSKGFRQKKYDTLGYTF